MIITENLPFGVIKNQLKKTDKISIVSCNTCARMCETGGEEAIKKTDGRLKKEGFNVVDTNIVAVGCDMDQVKRIKVSGNVILVLACDAGAYALKKMFSKKKIILALDTVGLAAWNEKGNMTMVKKFEK